MGINQSFYQGLFLAPTVVAGALKGAIFAANIYEKQGFCVMIDDPCTNAPAAIITSESYPGISQGSGTT